jgi:hypothetical protein
VGEWGSGGEFLTLYSLVETRRYFGISGIASNENGYKLKTSMVK